MVSAAVTLMGTESQTSSFATKATGKSNDAIVSFQQVMSSSLSTGYTSQSYSGTQKTAVTDTKSQPVTSQERTDSTVSKADTTKSHNANETDYEKVSDDLNRLAEDVKDKLQEAFGISDEALEAAMAELGIGMLDLLQPQQLTALVLTVTGQEDMLSFLVNGELSSGLQDLLGFVENEMQQLADAFGISPEAFTDLAQSMAKQQTAANTELDVPVEQQLENVQPQETMVQDVKNPEEPAKEVEEVDEETKDMAEVITSKLTTTKNSNDTGTESAFSKNSNETEMTTEGKTETAANNMAQSITETFQQVMVNVEEGISAVEIVRQVVDAVKITATQQLQSIEIQLNPENLGKITMNVSAKNGVVTAQLVAENEQVKHALENQMVTLKERFDSQGIKVDAVEVTVQSHSFEANENLKGNDAEEQTEGKKGLRHINLDSLEDLEDSELSPEELRARDLIHNGISSVEYSA